MAGNASRRRRSDKDGLDPNFIIPRDIVQKATQKIVFDMHQGGAKYVTERYMNEALRHIYTDLIGWANRPPVEKRRQGDYRKRT